MRIGLKIFIRVFILILIISINHISYCSTKDEFCNISPETGRITAKNKAESDITVYHIQDAHCQPDAQYNIARIIEKILAKNKDTIVAIEGASGIINVNRYREFPDKKVLSDVSKYFVNNGYISGAEYLSITKKEPFVLAGTENPQIYGDDHKLMIESIDKMSVTANELDKLNNLLSIKVKSVFNQDQTDFITKWSDYHQEKVDFQTYITYLISILRNTDPDLKNCPMLKKYSSIAQEEKNIDFAKLENERLRLFDQVIANNDQEQIKNIFKLDLNHKLNKISTLDYFKQLSLTINSFGDQEDVFAELKKYTGFLELSSSIDITQLNDEVEKAINHCADNIFTAQNQKKLFELNRYALFYRDLINLRVDSTGLGMLDNTHSIHWLKQSFVNLSAGNLQIDWNIVEDTVQSAFTFYRLARTRDTHMIENLISLMKQKKSKSAVIITGGFHQDGILYELRERNISYCSIKPSIKKVSTDTKYFSLVQNIKSPFERWVSGSTLAVASWLSDEPLAGAQLKPAREQIFSSMLISTQIRNIAPPDLESIKKNLSEILSKTEVFLDSWLEKYASNLEIESVELIGRNLAVKISIGSKEAVFLFHGSDSKNDFFDENNQILESGKLGNDIVEVTANETAQRIKSFIKASAVMDNLIIKPDSMEKLFSSLGLLDEYKNGSVSLNRFFTVLKNSHQIDLSLSDIFEAANYISNLHNGEIHSDEIVDTRGNPIKLETPLKFSDLNKTAFEILRNIEFDDNLIPVEKFGPQWSDIFRQRGISHFAVDLNIPFEAFANMLYSVIFTPPLNRGITDFAKFDNQLYQLRTISLSGGTFFVRMASKLLPFDHKIDVSESMSLYQGISHHSTLNDGVIIIETDGSFSLSYIALPGTEPFKFKPTKLVKSLKNTSYGKDRASQLKLLTDEMRSFALDHGILIRGIILRDQNENLNFFDNQDDLLEYISENNHDRFKPLQQSKWAENCGQMSVDEFTELQQKYGIILGDLNGGFEIFSDITGFTDFNGKNVLDVGSQLGYNVFYAHFKGASFSAGIDINPYQQKAAREIAAYINENERLYPEQKHEPNTETNILAPNGTTNGQLYFRTMELKDKEKATGKRIAQKPPENIEFAIADARDIPYPDDSFDIVTSSYLLFFINNASTALKEMIRVTKPGGIIQFNYTSTISENKALFLEALDILREESSISVDYEILSATPEKTMIRIISKNEIKTSSEDIRTIRNFSQRGTNLPNNFEERPYIYSIHSPITVKPEEYRLIESKPIVDVNNFNNITAIQKKNLIAIITFLKNIYGTDSFKDIENIQIDTGRNSIAELKNNSLQIHLSGLDHPLILLTVIEHELFENCFRRIPNNILMSYDVMLAEIDLFKEVSSIFLSVSNFVSNFSSDQQNDLIKYLKSSMQIDTDVEIEAFNYANLIENILSQKWDDIQVISEIIKFIYKMPQYKKFQGTIVQLNPSIKENKIDHAFAGNALNFVNLVSDQLPVRIKDKKPYYSGLTPHITELYSRSQNPDSSIKEWMKYMEYYNKAMQMKSDLPNNLRQLIDGENFERIFTLYPQTGFHILSDLFRSLINDSSDKPEAPYLTKFESAELMDVIVGLDQLTHKPSKSSFSVMADAVAMLKTLPPTAWIGPKLHDALLAMNHGKQYSVINVDVTEDDVDTFLEKFRQEVRNQNITDNNLVVLKLTKPVEDLSGEPGTNVVIVAEFLDTLFENVPRMWFQSGFQENKVSYNKTFFPSRNLMDVTSVSFSPFFQKMRGIGSEFYHNEIALLQTLGFNGAEVKSSSHELRIYNMHEREYESEIDLDDLFNRKNIFLETKKHIACLYRLGIINDDDLDFAFSPQTTDEQIAQRIKPAIQNEKIPGETDLQMLNRKAAEFVNNRAKFDRISRIYENIQNNITLNKNYPEIAYEYSKIRSFNQMQDGGFATSKFLFEPESLKLERKLIRSAIPLEITLISAIASDRFGYLRSAVDLLSYKPDTNTAFSELAEYITWAFPFLTLKGKIPETMSYDNVPYAISFILRTVNSMPDDSDTTTLKSILTSANPVTDLITKSNEKNYIDSIRIAFRDVSVAFLETQLPQNLINIFNTLTARLQKAGFPFGSVFSDKKIFNEAILIHPRGIFRLLSYLAFNIYKPGENIQKTVERIKLLDSSNLTRLLGYLKYANYETFGQSLNNALDLINTGVFDFIKDQYAAYDKDNPAFWLAHDNTNITFSQQQNLVLIQNSAISKPKSSLDFAVNTQKWLKEHGIQSEIVKADTETSSEEYFLKTGEILLGLTPYSPALNNARKDANPLSGVEIQNLQNFTEVNLSQSVPFKWIPVEDNKGLLFSASITDYDAQEPENKRDYIQILISANLIQSGSVLQKRQYILKFKKDTLPEISDSIKQMSVAETMFYLSRNPQVYFSMTGNDIITDYTDIQLSVFNDLFYNLLTHMKPQSAVPDNTPDLITKMDGVNNICTLRISQTGNWEHLWNSDNVANAINIDKYSQDILLGLMNTGITSQELTEKNITITLTDGYWRTGDRKQTSPDGKTEIILDLRAFDNPLLLDFVIRHQFEQKTGISGEAKSLYNDVLYARSMPAEKQVTLINLLNSAGESAIAGLIAKSDQPDMEIIENIIKVLNNKETYPYLSNIFSGKSDLEIADSIANEIDSDFASYLREIGYDDAFEILRIMFNPMFATLKEAISAYKELEKKTDFIPFPEIIFFRVLDGNLSGMDTLVNFYFENPKIISEEDFAKTFRLYGYDIVPELMSNINGDTTRSARVRDLMNYLQSDTLLVDRVIHENKPVIKIASAQNGINYYATYDSSGKQIDFKEVPSRQLRDMLPELISLQTDHCVNTFSDGIDLIIAKLTELKNITEDRTLFSEKIKDINDIFHRLSETYHNISLADISQVELGKQSQVKFILGQFVSDLIGTPLSAAYNYSQFLESLHDSGKKPIESYLKFADNSIQTLNGIKNKLVNFKLIRDYYFWPVSDNRRFLIIDDTMNMSQNKEISELDFSSEKVLANQLANKIAASKSGDIYAIYFTGQNPSELLWLKDIDSRLKKDEKPTIVILSPNLTGDVIEKLIDQSGMDSRNFIFIGKDIISIDIPDLDIKNTDGKSLDKLINLVKQNVDGITNMIFLTSDQALFSGLKNSGQNVLPLPDITIRPNKFSTDRLINRQIFDQAA